MKFDPLPVYIEQQLQIVDMIKVCIKLGIRDKTLRYLLDRWYFLQRLIREVS